MHIRYVFPATVICLSGAAHGVIVYQDNGVNPPTATRLTTAPSGDRGWSFQGDWGSVSSPGSGTPIAPNYFITAKHLGVAATFTYNSVNYTLASGTNIWDDPNSDLRIVKVAQTFPTYAKLYTKPNELTKQTAVFGRGVAPGNAVTISGDVHGWEWQALSTSGPRSWGANVVAGFDDYNNVVSNTVLTMTFDANGSGDSVTNEGAISAWDSGGGTFIQDSDGIWKLAGVNYGVDGSFRVGPSTPPNLYTLFDAGGTVYNPNSPIGDNNPWAYGTYTTIINEETDDPTTGYASRIYARLDWIGTIVPTAVPEPAGLSIIALAMAAGLRRRRA